MNKIRSFSNSFVEKATIKRALLATLFFGLLMYLIDYSPIGVSGLLKITGDANILDFEKGYSLDKAYTMLKDLGSDGRDFYLHKIMPQDIMFPMSVMLFFSCWISVMLKKVTKQNSPLRLLTYVPLLTMLCDWGENVGITAMLINYPDKLSTVCAISSAITITKFVFLISGALAAVILLVCTVTKLILNRK